ncbi:MAG: hypothetical protein ACJ736_37420 [Streptomyces sp.]
MGNCTYEYQVASALPLAHVAEGAWSLYLAVHRGGHLWCCPNAVDLLDSLHQPRAGYFMTVPRAWEKTRQGVDACLASPDLAAAGRAAA